MAGVGFARCWVAKAMDSMGLDKTYENEAAIHTFVKGKGKGSKGLGKGFLNNNYSGQIRCNFCGENGHRKSACPK